MFKMFSKNQANEPSAQQSVNEIIQEIHDTFYTEVDRLLESAKIMRSADTTLQSLIDKSSRLKSLGFSNTKECMEADKEIDRLEAIRKENESKAELIKAINYFSMKYPLYKFITEDSVKRICGKYNLIYGDVSRFKGIVPEKNLQDMERFSIEDMDKVYLEWYDSPGIRINLSGRGWKPNRKAASFQRKQRILEENRLIQEAGCLNLGLFKCIEAPLEIAAPASDFDTEGMEIKDFKLSEIEIPDPIVLQPVYFNETKHYLVVTAWGIEASDEDVVNQRMN